MHPRRMTALAAAISLAAAGTVTSAVLVAAERRSAHDGSARPAAQVLSPTASPAGTTPATTSSPPPAELTVNGALIPTFDNDTVASALEAAGVTLQPGHYLSVVRHRRLGDNGRPGRIYLDRRPATLTSPVIAGDTVLVEPGRDVVEPTETAVLRVAAAVPSALYVGGRSGLVRVTRGSYSHEIVSSRVIRRPTVGHLVRPGAVALTFDDGPALGWTPQVLKMLARHHVQATFCLIGSQAAAHPRLVRSIARAGHALCDHTWDHDLDLRRRPTAQIGLDIRRGARAITRATHGVAPTFFRAPGGNWSPALERLARKQGMTSLKWTVDPKDWTRPGRHSILHTVYQQLRPGGVILMHDGGGNRSQTIAALRVLLHRLPRLGYHFVVPPTG